MLGLFASSGSPSRIQHWRTEYCPKRGSRQVNSTVRLQKRSCSQFAAVAHLLAGHLSSSCAIQIPIRAAERNYTLQPKLNAPWISRLRRSDLNVSMRPSRQAISCWFLACNWHNYNVKKTSRIIFLFWISHILNTVFSDKLNYN